jgi:hypothetical protein
MLPALDGRPIRVAVRRSLGPHLAATDIRRRVILLDAGLLASRGEFERILVHEIFHFVWVRLSNQSRRGWEQVLAREFAGGIRGELGWSSEWRKNKLTRSDARRRTPAWRRYACESFCDTAAWRFGGLSRHDEFTLEARYRLRRQTWFKRNLESRCLPV